MEGATFSGGLHEQCTKSRISREPIPRTELRDRIPQTVPSRASPGLCAAYRPGPCLTGTGVRLVNADSVTSRPRRYRRCPSCFQIHAAGEYICLTTGPNWNQRGAALRECPNCGHQGRTSEFGLVADSTRVYPIKDFEPGGRAS